VDLDLDAAALTAQLVDFPSVSGEEGPLADAIEGALRSLPHLAVHRDGNAIVARTMLGRPERVILAGHIDTVPLAGNLPSRAEGPRLYGCGTTDMKSGVAVQLRLAAHLASPARDVTYVFYDCEEVGADRNGLLRLSCNSPELLAGDFAVLMEPSSAQIEGGCQGTLRAEITVAGKRAHTARAWMGRNAIHQAGAILDVLRRYTPREPDVDGLRYHEGLNAVAIRGGVAGNVVPDECVVTVNYRFAPDRDGDQAAEFVRSMFQDWPVTVLDVADGARPGLRHPAAAAFASVAGGTPRPKLGWTDVARFAALGIPAVNYGPGISEIAHTPDEYVEIDKIAECESRLRAWLSAPLPGPPYRAGPLPSLIEAVCLAPPTLSQMTDTTSSGWYLEVMAVSEPGVVTAWPSREVITSPGLRPPDCAAEPHKMPTMSAPLPAGAIRAGSPDGWLPPWHARPPPLSPPPALPPLNGAPRCSSAACCRGSALLLCATSTPRKPGNPM
jgi:succinyl-diaminopimelate desuccinylase